ncbi:phosphomethylpyrimidine synthase ThiC [Rhodopseudomonas sp. HC1]|uniref:phosphomethylpyrimidine synthase ThiC n=1 Tax=Rhodopseudomonas infernalis TaxID=2897386 RepID=UPI001EE90B32|nr:phosphomethylpyrimidine synthase ThiC [Rhodopseudomonas infernalis]MCG6204618.1 phosphomethylpyrimidine synthase ThiC [Rhodopseudomonas infernalis]
MAHVTYNSPDRLRVGAGLPVRVNLSFGVENSSKAHREISKISALLGGSLRPDLLMDLSIEAIDPEPWAVIRSVFSGPIGMLPHYTLFSESRGLEEDALLERIRNVTSRGVNFITIHCSPTRQLFELACRVRKIPTTSRGGGVVIRDMLINDRKRSIFALLFPDICRIASDAGTVINLGTAFRSATVADGLDDVVKEEIRIQAEYVEVARSQGVKVVLEGPGHIRADQLSDYWRLIEPLDVPPMPLGPMVSDRYPIGDHIASAIGAAQFMSLSRGGVINAITAVEHQGGVPNLRQMQEGLQAALVAAQVASTSYCEDAMREEQLIANRRAARQSCVMDSKETGCSRCERLCPLVHKAYDIATNTIR